MVDKAEMDVSYRLGVRRAIDQLEGSAKFHTAQIEMQILPWNKMRSRAAAAALWDAAFSLERQMNELGWPKTDYVGENSN